MDIVSQARFKAEAMRYNNRLQQLFDKFGENSPIYQNEQSKLLYWLPDENIRYNKNGVIQIAKPINLSDKMSLNQFQNLKIKRYGDIKKQYEQGYKDIKQSFDDVPTFEKYVSLMSGLAEKIFFLSNQTFRDKDEQRIANKALSILSKSHNSYSELLEVASLADSLETI